MMHVADIETGLRETATELTGVLDNMTRLGRVADEISDIPEQLFDGLDIERLNCAYLPPEFGGDPTLGASVTRCVLAEMLGGADPALGLSMPGPSLALPTVSALGSTEQRRDFFERFASSEPIWGAFAITEPGGGSDAMNIATVAVPQGDGYVLSGEKCFVGSAGRASFVLVFATVDPSLGRFGIRPFIVDRGTEGLTIDDHQPTLGLKAMRIANVRLDRCWVPEDRLVGASGATSAKTLLGAQRAWEFWRPALSALILGAVERLLSELNELAVDSAERQLKTDIALLAGRARQRAASVRLLVHHSAALYDAEKESAMISSMAKTSAANLARASVADALSALNRAQLGADSRVDIERWARDFQMFEMMEGTTEVHQLMITRTWAAQMQRVWPSRITK